MNYFKESKREKMEVIKHTLSLPEIICNNNYYLYFANLIINLKEILDPFLIQAFGSFTSGRRTIGYIILEIF